MPVIAKPNDARSAPLCQVIQLAKVGDANDLIASDGIGVGLAVFYEIEDELATAEGKRSILAGREYLTDSAIYK